ncbi:hypothetical protein Sango_1746200 [Sesamum angolense]|uniref:Uncharacterized protein n=1 Tax=Sesamum angolense TaxID=2727404 RepID=A0AAE1WM81_9LAMI|nr:hypothetical protein Sango_1746200 [Sesamum angolense]
MLSSLNRYVPTIREQLQDWEDGLCESDADGSFLHENWNFFAEVKMVVSKASSRAESELQSISGNNLAQNLQCLDSLKAQLSQLFGVLLLNPHLEQHSRDIASSHGMIYSSLEVSATK